MIAVTTVPVSVVKTAAEAVEGVGSEVAGRLSVDPAGVDAWLVVSVVVVNAVEAHSLAAGSSAAGSVAPSSAGIGTHAVPASSA